MVNGIRLPDTLLNEQECENEKRKMAFGKDGKVILFVGRLDEMKKRSQFNHSSFQRNSGKIA